MQLKLSVANPPVKVLVHGAQQLEHLLLVNRETHPLKHVVELIDLNVIVLVIVNFLEDLLQCEASLFEDLNQMVKYFVLHASVLPFFLNPLHFLPVVADVELVKLLELDYPIFIAIDFLKQCSHLTCF
jgi:hypothetical protein